MTTFNTRYQFSFLQAYPVYKDADGIDEVCPRWRVQFQYPDYDGEVTDLLPGGDPLIIEAVDSPDNRLNGIWPLAFTFNLTNLTSDKEPWDIYTLAVKSDREVFVVIELDETGVGDNYFVQHYGYVTPVDFKVEHGPSPYLVQITATDGLGSAKDFPITNLDGTPLSGWVSLTQALRAGAFKCGYIAPLVTSDNLYEKSTFPVGHAPESTTDPLYETVVKSETFITENSEIQYAYDAIKRVVESRTARFSQAKGAWYHIRTDEADGNNNPFSATNFTIHTRRYEGVQPSSAATVEGEEVLKLDIGRGGKGWIKAGSPVDILPQIKKGVRIDQDFGRNINKLPNGDWSNVDNTGLPIGWIRQNISATNSYRSGQGTDIDPFFMTLVGQGDEKINLDTPCIWHEIVYDKSSLEYQQSYERIIKGQFEISKVDAAKIVVLANKGATAYLLEEGGTWKKNPGKKDRGILIYHYTDTPSGRVANSGRAEINIKMEGMTGIDKLRIYVCVGEAMSNVDYSTGPGYVKYYGLRMEVGLQNQNLNGTAVRIGPKKVKIDTVSTLSLGDIPDLSEMVYKLLDINYDQSGLAYYKTNTTFRRSDKTPTQTWYEAKDLDHKKGKTLLEWTAQSYAKDQMQPAWTFEGDILARFPHAMHTLLRLLDFGEVPGATEGQTSGPIKLVFRKEVVNVVYSKDSYGNGVYLPWIEYGMQLTITNANGNSGLYTVTTVGPPGSTNWYFLVDAPVTDGEAASAVITQIIDAPPSASFTPYLLQLTRWKFSARFALNTVTAVRMPTRYPATLTNPDFFWKTPGGDLPLGLDEEGLPVNPAGQKPVSQDDLTIRKLRQLGALPNPSVTVVPRIGGFVPIEPGSLQVGLKVKRGGLVVGLVRGILREQQNFFQ